jgi:hypothetical protein
MHRSESKPLIPILPLEDPREPATQQSEDESHNILDEVAELAGLSKRQLYWISVGGIVFKICAVCLVYLAYKHHIGPFSEDTPVSQTLATEADKPLY